MSLFGKEKEGRANADVNFKAIMKSPELIKNVYEELVRQIDLLKADNSELKKEIEDLKIRISKQELRAYELRNKVNR
jgi:hypothetical protein